MTLPLDFVIRRRDSISQVRAASSGIYWLAGIAAEDGRVTVRRSYAGETIDLTPGASVRTRVMEYGGGAYDVDGEVLVFNDDRTNQLFLRDPSGMRPITPEQSRFYFGGLHLQLADGVVVAVREDHEAIGEPRTELVALPITEISTGSVVASGADFYAAARIRDGVIAWQQWDHPHMSWDTSSIWRARLDDPENPHCVFAADNVSAQHPIWLGEGKLAYSTDENLFWNWHVVDDHDRLTFYAERDCDIPLWVLDRPAACTVGSDLLATIDIKDGYGRLALWQPTTGGVTYPLRNTVWIESIASYEENLFVVAHWADKPASLVALSPTGSIETIAGGEASEFVAMPSSRKAGEVHYWFYAPPGVNKPPVIVRTHGGPTAQATASYNEEFQFWLSRGFAIADVNYRGSTGFGRAYRDALKGNWGVADIEDVLRVVDDLREANLIDPNKVAIEGGSAGGYTTLRALTTTDIFAAGISKYGIGDLESLALDTHKFESHYTFSLIGPWPEAEQLYRERSPIHSLAALRTPMLILQGLEDKVVPPSQAYQMAEAVRAAGKPLALVTFEKEAHGFRSMSARSQSLAAELSFLEQVFGIALSSDIDRLEIENL